MINRSYSGSQFGTHFLTSNIRMLANQALAPWILVVLERVKGFEPSTPTLARLCSTPELHPRRRMFIAGDKREYQEEKEGPENL